jgi:carboxylesterase
MRTRSRASSVRARDGEGELARNCESELLTHGSRTGHAVVLLHGFTNCPRQFHALAESLFARGCNVVVPRLRHHGLADRMTTEQARLTADDLTDAAWEAVDIAHGLGDTVCVAGLSITAVAAGWAAQERSDVGRAVLLAPAFSPKHVGAMLEPFVTRLAARLPNMFIWWDGKAKLEVSGPKQCYPRFSTRGLGETYRLGEALRHAASRVPPPTPELVLVSTEADHGIENALVDSLAQEWRGHGAFVVEYRFPAADSVNHDMVDPEQPDARVALVYPVLVRFLAEPLPKQ